MAFQAFFGRNARSEETTTRRDPSVGMVDSIDYLPDPSLDVAYGSRETQSSSGPRTGLSADASSRRRIADNDYPRRRASMRSPGLTTTRALQKIKDQRYTGTHG